MDKKNDLSKASLKHGSYSVLMVVLVLAFLVAVNILVNKLPVSWVSYDMSDVKLYSIGDKTRDVIKTLDEDVTIYLIGETGNYDHILSQMLDLYEEQSSKIHVKNLDMNREFAILKQYNLDQQTIENGSVLVVSAERQKFIPESEIYELDYTQYYQSGYTDVLYNYDGEGEITSALIYVTTKEIPNICVVTGHNESELGSTITASIKKANYDIQTINLATGSIPQECDILFLNSPQTDYSADECNKIRDYVDMGGKLFVNCTTIPTKHSELTALNR